MHRVGAVRREATSLAQQLEVLCASEKELDGAIEETEKGMDKEEERRLRKREKELEKEEKALEGVLEEMAVRRMKADRLLGALERETRQLREEVKRGEKEDMVCALSEDTLRLLQWTEEKTVLDDSQVRAVRAAKRKTSRLCAEMKQKARDCASLIAALEAKQNLTVLRRLKEEKEEATTLQTALETIDTDLARCEQARRTAETERLDALKAAVETINRRMSALFAEITFSVAAKREVNR